MVALQLPVHFLCGAFFSWLANWSGLIRWRKAKDKHWTEEARILWPVRITAGLNVFLLPAILGLAQAILFPDLTHWWLADMAAAFLGAVFGCYPCDREVFPALNWRSWRNQVVAGWGIRFGIWGVLLLACVLMPPEVGWKMAVVAAAYLLVHFALQWGLILKYLRLVKFLVPADTRLLSIVNFTAAKMGVSVRATWQLEGVMALAFAFPITHELTFSRRLVEICSDDEISAICSHELAHLKEGKLVLIGRLVGSLSMFPLIFLIPSIAALGVIGFFLPYLGMIALIKFSKWLSQKMEKRADQMAVGEQSQDGVYAWTLEKIYRENKIPAVNVNNKQTHPHLYDRMVAAGITPDYPRPTEPVWLTTMGWIYVFSLTGLFVVLITRG
jgi:Zn-dependent protease with chaperone function